MIQTFKMFGFESKLKEKRLASKSKSILFIIVPQRVAIVCGSHCFSRQNPRRARIFAAHPHARHSVELTQCGIKSLKTLYFELFQECCRHQSFP